MPSPPDSDPTETCLYSAYRTNETPVEAIVTAVADVTGQSPLELDPLGEVVDTDALNTLVNGHDDRAESVTVVFDYCGQRVTATTDGVQITQSNSLQ